MSASIEIDQKALVQNLNTIKALAKSHQGLKISVVTKALVGHEALVRLLLENGAESICEAHTENLKKFKSLPAEKWLIRSPLISEADDVVRYADVSLVSEQSVLESLSAAALRQKRIHKAVIMLELGELREGCMPDELIPLCEAALALPGLALHGIGTHLSSMNEIVPDEDNMAALAAAAEEAEKALGITLPVVSGGSSSAIKMLSEGRHPARVNHLRIGEAIMLGNIVCYDVPYEGARTDVFTLHAEIMEVKEKPPEPWGTRACPDMQQPAKTPGPTLRKRALVAVGKQDVPSKYLIPLDPDARIIGDTSDCLIADITGCKKIYKPGDTLSFRLKYNGLVSAMSSSYIEKILI